MPNLYHWAAPDNSGAKRDPEHASYPTSISSATTLSAPSRSSSKYSILSVEQVKDAVAKARGSVKRFRKYMRRARADVLSADTALANSSEPKSAASSKSEIASGSSGHATSVPGGVCAPFARRTVTETDVLEVWFAGAHADVGGGAVQDSTPHMLSNVTLRWMARELAAAPVKVVWNPGALEALGIHSVASGRGDGGGVGGTGDGGVMGNGKDAIAPINDMLGPHGKWAWWVLECMPLTVTYQDKECRWKSGLRQVFSLDSFFEDVC
jgi:hypothetical protein